MTTWEEIRDEVAGMLADGKPLEDVLAKLEERKNEMTKANLLKAMDDIKKQKQTNEEYMQTCNSEELGCFICEKFFHGACGECRFCEKTELRHHCILGEWLKQPHRE